MEGLVAGTTVNFHDDPTHIKPYSCDDIIDMLSEISDVTFRVIEKGTIGNPYLEEMLFGYAYQNQDREIWNYALWLHYHWADFVILQKL